MENIYEGCNENEKGDIIHNLESNFTSVFQQLVEKTEQSETQQGSLGSSTNTEKEISSSNEVDENEPKENQHTQIKPSQTNSTIVQRNLELHLRYIISELCWNLVWFGIIFRWVLRALKISQGI